jgi:hypothetical protein
MLGGDEHNRLEVGVLTRWHWLLLWVGWILSTGVLPARRIVPTWEPWLGQSTQYGASVVMLVACVLAFRWNVQHGPGPYRADHARLRESGREKGPRVP